MCCMYVQECSSVIESQPLLFCRCAGPGGEAPENTAAVEEAADYHSG